MNYRNVNSLYQELFGCKVYKISLDGGFTCPNRDGTIAAGGCIFCSGFGGGAFTYRGQDLKDQITLAKAQVAAKNKSGKFIAYFQAFTNTYGPVERLEQLYRCAMEDPQIVGLSIGTRPDCLPEDVVALLSRLNQEKPVFVELGLQSVHAASVSFIRRGYPNEVYFSAVRRLRAVGIHVVTHIILGLPGETAEIMEQTTRAAVDAGTDGVKFHLLHILRGTDLEQAYLDGKVRCMTLEEYGAILKRCIALLPPETVVHRITGDGAKRDLIAPLWSADKKRVLNYLNALLSDSQHTHGSDNSGNA